jgi:hypothetical protein
MAGLYDNYVQTDNIFKGEAPSLGNYNWGSVSSNTDWSQTPSVDWTGSFDLPGLSGAGGLAARSSGTDWVQKGFEALNKALTYKSQNSTNPGSRSYRGYGSNAPTAVQGRGYTMFLPTPTQKTTQSGGSRGIGGALGTLAGIGVSMIPGVGPAAAAAAPALGGTLGGFFG